VFSRTSTRIAGAGGELFIVDADGSNEMRILNIGGGGTADSIGPSWSIDDQIAYQSLDLVATSTVLWVIEVVGVDGSGHRGLLAGHFPSWSPDGTQLTYHSYTGSTAGLSELGDLSRAEIHVSSNLGSADTRLTSNMSFDGVPSWAPRKSGVGISESSIVIPNASRLESSFSTREITAKVRSAVVRIETEAGSGSGFFINPDGTVLTNNHVITDGGEIEVCLDSGSCHPATVQSRDMVLDLAILDTNLPGDVPWLQIADISSLSIGEELLVAGYPLGSTELSVTRGLASTFKYDTGRNINWVQTDAAINPGNSGGPLLNLHGQVVGVASAKLVGLGIEGTGFAISANTIMLFLEADG